MNTFVVPSGNGQLPAPMQAANLPAEIDVNTEVDDGRIAKLQWGAGETKRIAACAFRTNGDKKVMRLRQQLEFSLFGSTPPIWFRSPDDRALAAQCAMLYGAAKPRIGGIWLEYETDTAGQLLANAGYKIKPWIYGPDRHVLIQNIVLSGWDLYTHDLLVTCGRGADDAKWQHLSITPCQDSLLRKLKPEIQEQIEVEATTLFDGALLKKFAPYKPPEGILKLIGATGYAGPMPSNMHNPFLGHGAQGKEPPPVNAPTSAFADMVARETQQAAPVEEPKKTTSKK